MTSGFCCCLFCFCCFFLINSLMWVGHGLRFDSQIGGTKDCIRRNGRLRYLYDVYSPWFNQDGCLYVFGSTNLGVCIRRIQSLVQPNWVSVCLWFNQSGCLYTTYSLWLNQIGCLYVFGSTNLGVCIRRLTVFGSTKLGVCTSLVQRI